MSVEVIVPDEYLGDVMGDLTLEGEKSGVWISAKTQVVSAKCH